MQMLKAAVSIVLFGGVVGLVSFYYDMAEILSDARSLSFGTLSIIIIALIANSFAAVLRFQVIATEIKHPIQLRRAMAVVSAGSLAGAVFFQVAGQLMARGIIAARGGIPFGAVVIITAYERFVAAIISALLALAGAFFIFGNVYLDQASGGADLIKIMCGLFAAGVAGALLGYGRIATQALTPLLTRHFVRRCLTVVGLTVLVQLPMMVAYVAAARALSPQTSIPDLIAASVIVMFAASVPISLAGWGVREMSALVALGAIGVAPHAALMAAVLIGVGSMLSMGLIAAMSLPGSTGKKQLGAADGEGSIDYYRALAWALPLTVATLVLFQVYVPIQSGVLNVNLADPLAILSGVIFILAVARTGLPRWRVTYINSAIMAATLVLTISLFIGAHRFGWTEWAIVNRFCGWFLLLAYGATGALIVSHGRKEALAIFALTFVGATTAVAALELVFIILANLGFRVPIVIGRVQGFSLNHNFFAFQLLMALSAAIVFARGPAVRLTILVGILLGLWFAGSRSGWIAVILVVAAGLYLGRITARETLLVGTVAVAVASLVPLLSTLPEMSSVSVPQGISSVSAPLADQSGGPVTSIPEIVPDVASTQERWMSIVGGLELFSEHPLFGAGLGAFRNKLIMGLGGQPLLIHSTAVWLLAELGVIGLLVFLCPSVGVLVEESRHARKDQTSALIVFCLIGLAAMSAPADMLYQRTFWILIGAGLALRRSA